MAERLVVSLYDSKANENKIVSIYYHWSACDKEAAQEELWDILKWINKNGLDSKTDTTEIQLSLIRFAEERGGGITGSEIFQEYKYIKSLFPDEEFKEDDIDRNKGLIALSPECMEDFENWADGVADVYIKEREMYNWVGSFEDGEEMAF